MRDVTVVERLIDPGEGFAYEMPVVNTWSGPVYLLQEYFLDLVEMRDRSWMDEVSAAAARFLTDSVPNPGPANVEADNPRNELTAALDQAHLEELFVWILEEHPRFAPDQIDSVSDRGGALLAKGAYRLLKAATRGLPRVNTTTRTAPVPSQVREQRRSGRWIRAGLVDRLRSLGLHGMAQEWAETNSRRSPPSPREIALIQRLLWAETQHRAMTSGEQQLLAAGFPLDRSLDNFHFDRALMEPGDKAQLFDAQFTTNQQNVVLVGGPGTGKTHLAAAIGRNAVLRFGKRARYYCAATLADDLQREMRQGRAGALAAELRLLDLVVLDGLGHQALNETERVLLFQLLSSLHGYTSVLTTSNVAPAAWFGPLGANGTDRTECSPVLHAHIRVILFATAEERDEADNIPF